MAPNLAARLVRPEGMHWRTFERLAARVYAAEALVWEDLKAFQRRIRW
jgi:hypothetical protein